MKHTVSIVGVLMIAILTGCTSSPSAYRSKVTLTPAPDAQHYDIAFMIEDVSDPANTRVMSTPRVHTLKGKECNISVDDEMGGVACTAIVDEASGKVEARTTVSVKKDGKVVWSAEQTVAMSK